MDKQTLWNEFNALPAEARNQITAFIAFLRVRYPVLPASPTGAAQLDADPFVGMWQDRKDITDSSAWVRARRKDEWHDNTK